MIEIEDWVLIAIIAAFFFAGACYLFYFIVSRKLFSQEMEFRNEIEPNRIITILSIEGAGIAKKIEMQITKNENSTIDMIIDGKSYSLFVFKGDINNPDKRNFIEQKNGLLGLEVNLNAKFQKNFSIIVLNRNESLISPTGKIFYEIKKPLKMVLKAIYSETFS
jgi:hypothetical protein